MRADTVRAGHRSSPAPPGHAKNVRRAHICKRPPPLHLVPGVYCSGPPALFLRANRARAGDGARSFSSTRHRAERGSASVRVNINESSVSRSAFNHITPVPARRRPVFRRVIRPAAAATDQCPAVRFALSISQRFFMFISVRSPSFRPRLSPRRAHLSRSPESASTA